MTETASADLEREAEMARARLSDTADELRARMTPGQIMDEVLEQFRGGDGTQMLANLKGQARDNPMALALIGGGVAWLMLGSGAPAPQARPHPARPAWRSGEGVPSGPGASPGDGGEMDRAERAAAGAGAVFGAVSGSVQDAVRATADGARGAAQGLRGAGEDAVDDMRAVGQRTGRVFADLLEREPLVVGALGFAVGAALGAALPASELERRHLGAAGAALKEKVDAGVAAAREATGEVMAAARDEADRRMGGRMSESIGAVVRAAGDKATEIVKPGEEDTDPALHGTSPRA